MKTYCIKRPGGAVTYCNRNVNVAEWMFVSIQHAVNADACDGILSRCPDCVAAVSNFAALSATERQKNIEAAAL